MSKHHVILAPHHDDAEFGLGGCIQKWLAAGDKVSVMIFYRGDYTRSDGRRVSHGYRMEETIASFKLLGLESWALAPTAFAENSGDADMPNLIRCVENYIRQEQPTDVYVCLPSFNQDHRALYSAAITAFRPCNFEAITLWAYEYPGNSGEYQSPATGVVYHEVTEEQVALKLAALNAHVSQWEGRKVGVCPNTSELMLRWRGAIIGRGFAEAVYLIHATA